MPKGSLSRSVAGDRRRRGAALIEMALVLPVLVMLVFGIVEFGDYYYVQHTLTGAARAGARAGIPTGATQTQLATAVSDALTAAGIKASDYTLTTTPGDVGTAAEGTSVNVTIKCTYSKVRVLPTALGWIPDTAQVTGVAVMRRE